MKIKPGCYEQYKQAHDQLWPEIVESMNQNNISMSIFHSDGRLFVHAVAPSESDWSASRQGEEFERWHDYMATLLETDANGDIVFEQMPAAFTFGMFQSDSSGD